MSNINPHHIQTTLTPEQVKWAIEAWVSRGSVVSALQEAHCDVKISSELKPDGGAEITIIAT